MYCPGGGGCCNGSICFGQFCFMMESTKQSKASSGRMGKRKRVKTSTEGDACLVEPGGKACFRMGRRNPPTFLRLPCGDCHLSLFSIRALKRHLCKLDPETFAQKATPCPQQGGWKLRTNLREGTESAALSWCFCTSTFLYFWKVTKPGYTGSKRAAHLCSVTKMKVRPDNPAKCLNELGSPQGEKQQSSLSSQDWGGGGSVGVGGASAEVH